MLFSCNRPPPSFVPESYGDWKQTTEIVLDYPVPGHQSNLRIIYINSIGEGVKVEEKDRRVYHDYPEGTIIIKEIYPTREPQPDEVPQMLLLMVKDSQHRDALGDWVWLTKTMGTGKETIIDYEFCIACHEGANENHPYGDANPDEEFRDYVFFPFLQQ